MSTPTRSARPKRSRGFTMMEAMVSISVSGIMLFGALASYAAAQHARGDARHEWTAFTLAQSQLEMLASARGDHPLLDDNTPDDVTELGGDADAQCETGVDGRLADHMRVGPLGLSNPEGQYTLCWKVTGGNPFGELKNIRVVVGYPASQGTRHVLLQTIR